MGPPFRAIGEGYGRALAQLFGIVPEKIVEWTHAGRYVSGPELAEAGLAELVEFKPLDLENGAASHDRAHAPRRNFLLGLPSKPIDEGPAGRPAGQAEEAFLVHLSRKAMAGEFEICLPVSIAGEATAAALEMLDLVQSIERQLSFFQPQSEISTVNREAADAARRG